MRSPIQQQLETLHARYAALNEGEVAHYIPELAAADPSDFAICIATADGHVYEVGDARKAFTIQSISKPFVFGLALADRGEEAVHGRIGVEPTGDAFNSISLEPETGRPLNPMINAGAIAASSLIAGHSEEDRQQRLLRFFSDFAGRPLSLDEKTYASEKETGHRNRAIGHMLRNFGILDEDPERALDLYFRQCSIRVDCRDLAVMAATLACAGRNPVTRESVLRPEFVARMLSLMSTCGMYDYAGEWLYRVGLPAKSGVGGGILAVLPGQLGIGVYSPPLDARGNSVRGVRVCQDLAHDFDLHYLRAVRPTIAAVHSRSSLRKLRSKRSRPNAESRLLDERGDDIGVLRLQGDLRFASIEEVIRELGSRYTNQTSVILDFARVTHVDLVATRFIADLQRAFAQDGRDLMLSTLQAHSRLRRFLDEDILSVPGARLDMFPDLDLAVEAAENRLLAGLRTRDTSLELAEHSLCEELSDSDVAHLRHIVGERVFAPGETIVHRGDPAGDLYFVLGGEVSVFITLPDGSRQRVGAVAAGAGFGESAMVSEGRRNADVCAMGPVRCAVLSRAAFDSLSASRASLKIGLLRNLLRASMDVSRRMGEELAFAQGNIPR